MRFLGVSGSGRVGGNTAALVGAVLDGACEAGAETSLMELGQMTVAGCRSCNACKDKRRCVVKDDMSRFYEAAPATDVLVLASPIYLDHITGQLMSFIQRMYCYIGAHTECCYPRDNVRAVLGITYEADGENMYDYVLEWMERRLKGYFAISTVGRFKIRSTRFDRIVGLDHPELQRARELGRTLAQG